MAGPGLAKTGRWSPSFMINVCSQFCDYEDNHNDTNYIQKNSKLHSNLNLSQNNFCNSLKMECSKCKHYFKCTCPASHNRWWNLEKINNDFHCTYAKSWLLNWTWSTKNIVAPRIFLHSVILAKILAEPTLSMFAKSFPWSVNYNISC